MTYLAFNLSHYINGVAKKHGEVLRHIFAHYRIDFITNCVHAETRISTPVQELLDHYISGWRENNASPRYALNIPKEDLWKTHAKVRQSLIQYVNHQTNAGKDVDVFIIGFARRATPYKRGRLKSYKGIYALRIHRDISGEMGLG